MAVLWLIKRVYFFIHLVDIHWVTSQLTSCEWGKSLKYIEIKGVREPRGRKFGKKFALVAGI